MPAVEVRADVALAHGAHELDAVLQLVALAHLLEVRELRPRAADDEREARVARAQARDRLEEQIDALAVHEAAEHDDAHCVSGARTVVVRRGVRRRDEARVDRVRDRGHVARAQRRTEHRVLARGVADAHDVVRVGEREAQQLVRQNAAHVREAKERVVGEHGAQAEARRVEEALVRHARERLVRVHDLGALAHEDRTEQREERKKVGQRVLPGDHLERHVVHLEPARQVAHACAVWRVRVGHDDHLRERHARTWCPRRSRCCAIMYMCPSTPPTFGKKKSEMRLSLVGVLSLIHI